MTHYRIFALFFLNLIFSCQSKEVQEQHEETKTYCLNEQLKKTTDIEDVHKKEIQEHIVLPGKIEYNENDWVTFKSLLEGVVESVHFELGDYVEKGQTLAIVRSARIQELNREQITLQNQIKLLEQAVETQIEMFHDGMLAQSELMQTQNELASAKVDLQRVYQDFALYQVTSNGKFKISASKAGYIIQKNISKGQTLTSDNETLFSISNLKQVWVMVNVYAGNLKYVKVGDEVQVKTIAFPNEMYNGTIDKVYNFFDEKEHVIKARVVLDNENLNLMPGLSAEILINKGSEGKKAFAIPNKAKIFNNNKEYVIIYKNDCDLKIRPITTIASNESISYIEEPFAEEEQIVASNALLLFEELNK